MQIVQVSAHYPPDFVSGGTLQPQRIARGLRAIGHEVTVLAGSLDGSRAPLEVWDEVDETGLPVRWVASGEFVWWDDVRNYDNPAMALIADELYASWRPDVVHCHSLQTLGVGPIEAAASRGIPVVVTMHDFWWLCARQFLVDTDDHPCSLVVAASDCPCEAGRAHLDTRARRLRAALAHVDQILVPSAAAADVLVANGIDADRLAVDENGVPTSATPPMQLDRPQRGTGRITVRYTGGGNPMKGADVLVAALRQLGPMQHVRVVAHNLDEALERQDLRADDVPAELAPAYAPAELDAVLADTDVLLLPSVMRETYSIVTREALSRGVPVIATDVLGPEEVVHDGRNGRIIPADDPAALARALQAIDDDPAVVDRWRRAIGAVTLRSVADQVDGLVHRYEVLGGRSDPRPAPAPLPSVLFVVGIQGAPLRYRAQLPAEAITLAGARATIRHYLDPDLASVAAGATHVVVYRVPATPMILDLIATWRAAGIPVAFDVDDLIFDPGIQSEIPALQLLDTEQAALWLEGVRRYRTTMEACDAYIGSTSRLVDHAQEVIGMPSFLFENGIGQALGAASDRALRRERRPGPPRVGYLSGTTTHDDDWRAIAPAVLRVLERHPEVELWLGGHLEVEDAVVEALPGRLRRHPFTPWHELPEILRDLDVNLAPLAPGSRFNDAKSAIKWLEAALCETPTIASPTEPFRQAIDDGRTGRLADRAADWERALDQLLRDPDERGRIGRQARRAALLQWPPPLQGRRYLEVLDGVAQAHLLHRAPSEGWQPEARDERAGLRPVLLEAYPSSTGEVRTATSARAVYLARQPKGAGRAIRVLQTSLRDEGPVATVRRILRAANRRAFGRLTRGGA